MKWGDEIKRLRIERGATQKDIARYVGVDQRTISYYEDQEYPPFDNFNKILEYYNLNLIVQPKLTEKQLKYTELFNKLPETIKDKFYDACIIFLEAFQLGVNFGKKLK